MHPSANKHHAESFVRLFKRYQNKCDELEVRQKDFSTNYNNIVREKKDIVLYLKRTLSQKEDELADTLEKLQEMQAAKDAEKEVFDRQLSVLRSEFQETKDKLTSENMVLGKNKNETPSYHWFRCKVSLIEL